MPATTKKCPFKGCERQIPEEDTCCDGCVYELHVEIRRQQGFTREEARIEWEREAGPNPN